MPPPQAPPATGPNAGRTQPPSPAPPTPQQGNKAPPKGKKDTKDTRKVCFHCLIFVVLFLLNIFLASFKEGKCGRQRQYRGHTLRSGASAFDSNHSSTPKFVQQTRTQCNHRCPSTANIRTCPCTSAYGATTTAATAARPAAAV